MWCKGKRPDPLSRIIAGESLDGAVLCAQQWTAWSHAEGRGRRAKYAWYRVETRATDGEWQEVAGGTLADAKACWTKDDEARIDGMAMVKPLIGQQGTTRQVRRSVGRSARRPQTRLAALVQQMKQQK